MIYMATKTKKQQVVKKVQKIDLDILYGLYQYRALSIRQIKRKYNMSQRYTYKKMQILYNTGWVHKGWITGYTKNQRKKRQGAYYRISETGIACLRKQGYPVERKAYDLRVSENFLPYLLSTNDLIIDLKPFNWTYQDSREVKRKYNLNRGDSLQGILKNNGKEYVIYMLMEKTTKITLKKIANEIESYSDHQLTKNYIIFVRGQKSYNQVTDYIGNHIGAITTSRKIKVMPMYFAKMYLRQFHKEQVLINYLKGHGVYDITNKVNSRHNKTHKGLTTIVQHDGESKYLVNLLDSDLIKIQDIHSYRKEQYRLDGKRILIVTTNGLINQQQEMLQSVKHIDWLSIDHRELINYLSKVSK